MSRISEILKLLGQEPISSESVFDNLNKLLNKYGISASVCDVEVDYDGHIFVDFCDVSGENYIRVIFTVDDNDVYAIIDTDDEDVVVFDLESMRPVLRDTSYAKYVDLTNSSWITATLLKSILTAGSYLKSNESYVMHGGKPKRIPVCSSCRRDKLSYKQKEALAKSITKRKYSLSNSININLDLPQE